MKKIVCIMLIALALCVTVSAQEVLLFEDKCEEEIENVSVMTGSWDGSKYYRCDTGVDLGYLPNETSSDFLYELDIRFNNEGCGFSFMKKGKWNSCIRIKDNHLALQTGSNSFDKLCEIDLDKWYHFTFLGRTNRDANSVTYGHIVLEEYDGKERVNKRVFRNVNLRNNAATHYINAFGGCDIDNLKASTPAPTEVELVCDSESIVAGQSVQFGVKAFYNELEMHGVNTHDITFELLDEEGFIIEGENVRIDRNGLVTTSPLAPTQTISVRAVSKSANLSSEKNLRIVSGDIFTVTGIGINEEKTKIIEIAARKNFAAYKDAVTFVVTFSDASGNFIGADFKQLDAKVLTEGENWVNVSIEMPLGFDINTGKINVFIITTMQQAAGDEAVKARIDEIAETGDAMTVIALKDGSDTGKIKAEDIIYFDVVYSKEEIKIPESGQCFVLGKRDGVDTLFEIIK